jgi:DNA-binding transcriptional MerR regulator
VGAVPTEVALLTIGELADRTGVTTSTLRYYDQLGLVRPVERVSGRRRYDERAVQQVGVVLLLRDLRFTLAEIATLLADRPSRRAAWAALARGKAAELDRLIHDAGVARSALTHGLDCPEGDPAACPRFWSIVEDRLAGRPLEDR